VGDGGFQPILRYFAGALGAGATVGVKDEGVGQCAVAVAKAGEQTTWFARAAKGDCRRAKRRLDCCGGGQRFVRPVQGNGNDAGLVAPGLSGKQGHFANARRAIETPEIDNRRLCW
jgi:hypothetical protein